METAITVSFPEDYNFNDRSIKLLQGMLTEASAGARKLAQEDLPALNKMMNEAGVPHIVVPRGGGAAAGPAMDDDVGDDPDDGPSPF